jgi:hypothetical protein
MLGLMLLPVLAHARAVHPPSPPPSPTPMVGPLTPPAMCEAAIAAAEAETKLPARVLNAISLRESGRIDPDSGRARPWPWTINYLGAGHFYASKEEAVAAVQQIQAEGGQSIDIGCMQVNLMHHPDAFASLEEAFDPVHNASYGGRFLRSLFAALGDWGTAIAAYHSRTPGLGEPYRDQVVATWNPKDPEVLAKLSFQPLPALIGPIGGPVPGLPMIYAPFAARGPVMISPNMAYRAFLPASSVYQSFRSPTVAYADFNRSAINRSAIRQVRGRPLDLRLNVGFTGSGRALVVPTGILEHGGGKPSGLKQAGRRGGEAG